MTEPRVLWVNHEGNSQPLNLDNIKTREDLIAWIKFFYPRGSKTYIDTYVDLLFSSIKHYRGEDDISGIHESIKWIVERGFEGEVDISPLERIIEQHNRRRQAFHLES